MPTYFSSAELSCHCCGAHPMDPAFLQRLTALRVALGQPMRLSSAYRCPPHNGAVSATGPTGPHTTGRAVDVLVSGAAALELVEQALAYGFTGIGVSQKGPHARRFVHLDDLPTAPGQPRPTIWSY